MINFKKYINGNPTQLLKEGFIYTLSGIFNKAIPFLFLPIMTNYLSPADYGLFNNFTLLSHIIALLLVFSMNQALSVNYYKKSKEEVGQYIENIIILVGILFFVVLVLGSASHSLILKYLKLPYQFFLLALASSLFSFFNGLMLILYRLERKPIKFGIFQNLITATNFTLGIVFVVLLLLNWQGRVYSLVISSFLFSIFSLVIISRKYHLRFRWHAESIKDLIHFGLPLIPHSLGLWVKVNIAKVILTNSMGLYENGIYSIGIQIAFLLRVLIDAFSTTYSPYLFKKLTHVDEKGKKMMVIYSYILFVAFLVLAVILNVFAQWLVPLYIKNPAYHEALNYLPMMLFSIAFIGMNIIVANYISFSKQNIRLTKVTLPISGLYLVMCYYFVNSRGIDGAVLAMLITDILTFILVWIQSNKAYPMPWLFFRKGKS